MNSKRVLAALSLSLLALVAACEDDPTTPAPDAPPQIQTTIYYGESRNAAGEPTGLPNIDVYDILALSNGTVWLGTPDGIAVYSSINATTRTALYNEINGLPNRKVRTMIEHSGKVYVGTWGGGIGVYDIAGAAWSSLTTANGLLSDQVADIAVSTLEDRLYVATNAGVSILNPLTSAFASYTNLLDPVVSSVEVRTDGVNVERWYGPRLEGYVNPPDVPLHGITTVRGAFRITFTTGNSGLAEPNVNDIYYDAQTDRWWVAFASKGIGEVNTSASTWTIHTDVQGLPSNTVYSITRAAGTLWAGTQKGLARQKPDGTWQGYARSGGLPADRVRKVYSDDGERLWVAYIEAGAGRVSPSSAQ